MSEKNFAKHIDILLKGIEGVLFDIDGTLMNSMGFWRNVDEIYLARHNKPMPDDLQHNLSGLSVYETAKYFQNVIGIEDSVETMLAEWNELAVEEYMTNVSLKAGVMQFVRYLADKGIPMAVGTSNTRFLATTALKVHEIDQYFNVILTGEDVLKGKPEPYIYQQAAKLLGVDPSNCLVFEDIPAGIMAGKAAGAKVCAVWDNFSKYQDEDKKKLADYYINDFTDIFKNKVEFL